MLVVSSVSLVFAHTIGRSDARGVISQREYGMITIGRSNPLDLDYTQVQLVPEDERGNGSKA